MTKAITYNLEIYASEEYARSLNLNQNSCHFEDIKVKGKIPEIGEQIFLPVDIFEYKLCQKEAHALGNKEYKVINVKNEISKIKRGLESKATVIAELVEKLSE